MRRSGRLTPLLLLLLGAVVVVLVEVHAVGYAFALAGLSPEWVVVVLASCLLGSMVDIAVARLHPKAAKVEYRLVPVFDRAFLVPVPRRSSDVTILVNVGGAVIPTLVSAYLLARLGIWVPAAVAVTAVAVVVHLAARPLPGEGIVVPMFLPAMAATAAAVLLHPDPGTPALAYVAGTLGTLIGGDLTNLHLVRRLGARGVSIGGAGTFDGIFLSGVLAVLLASAAL